MRSCAPWQAVLQTARSNCCWFHVNCRFGLDAVKFISGASCDADQDRLASGTVTAIDLEPGDSAQLNYVELSATFGEVGNFTVCYRTQGVYRVLVGCA